MKIRLIGPRNTLGVGVHFSYFADALKSMSGIGDCVEEVDCTSQEKLLESASRTEPDDVNICFVSINMQSHFRGTNIQWIVFESTKVPEIIMSTMLASNLVWVPSVWGKQTLIQNGMPEDRVEVMPEGVDTNQYHPYQRKISQNIVRFLSVGKYEERKSQLETIMAWAQVFKNDSGVELVIKTDHFFNAEPKRQSLENLIQQLGLTNVKLIWGKLDVNSLSSLYNNSDIFVLPSKGEGWGLPLIEAAAAGLPIITTCYSGHNQFLEEIKSSILPVDYSLGAITCPEFQQFYPTTDGNFGMWAIPKVESIASALQTARNNLVALKQQAVDNSEIIRTKYNWARCADRVVKTLQNRGLLR